VKKAALVSPFLIALAFLLTPYAVNSYQMVLEDLLPPLLAIFALVLVLVGVLAWRVREVVTAGTVASLLLLCCLSYGPVTMVVSALLRSATDVATWKSFLAAWLFVSATAMAVVLSRPVWRVRCGRLLLILAAIMSLTPLLHLGIQAARAGGAATWMPEPIRAPMLPRVRPDVYFVVLDGYGRDDVLQEKYGYDNREFLTRLRRDGFVVAQHSASNYAQTHLSLASSLNMCYLDELRRVVGDQSMTRIPLLRLIAENRAARLFREAGYRYVTISTGYLDTQLRRADAYYPGSLPLSQFSMTLLGGTPLAAWPRFQYDVYRRRLNEAFDRLSQLATDPHPLFVVAHITIPHHPFVFTGDGSPVTPARRFTFADDVVYYRRNDETRGEYVSDYLDQLKYVNAKVTEALRAILGRNGAPPVIVLQADHGPSLDWNDPANVDTKERMAIFNAYLLPGKGQAALYDSVTPVNTLRIVATEYLGCRLSLLPDRSYYSSWLRPYDFREVTDTARRTSLTMRPQ
jgi:hypothetical protein